MKTGTATPEAVRLFHEGSIALAQMEHNGMRVDTSYLQETSTRLNQQIVTLRKELREDKFFRHYRKHFGMKANLGSLPQLGKIVFDVLKYPSIGTTATGRYRTDEEAFEVVDIPFVAKLRKLRKLEKVQGTYLKNFFSEVVDGFIHPVFNLHTVITFRGSSDSPNAQNIPIRDPESAAYVRRGVIPRKGRRLIEFDFKGAEVSVSACYNHDPVLIEYIKNPKSDMHGDTAQQLFMLKREQVEKKTTRDASKNRFVFPEFYGSVYFQCAPDLWKGVMSDSFRVKQEDGKGISIREHLASKGITELGDCSESRHPRKGTYEYLVKQVEDDFWSRRFKVYTRWKNKLWEEYQQNGEMLTYTGFRIAGDMRRNQVLNAPIQGSAFHCLLWSIIQIQKWLTKYKMKTKLICQIHDSLIADVVPSEQDAFLARLKEIITVDLPKVWKWIIVPLSVEAEASEIDGNWFEKKEIQL